MVTTTPAATPAAPPSSASRIASARNWVRMWPLVAPRAAAEPDLGAAFEHGDDHDVGDADGADEQGDRAEAEEQAVEGAFGVGLGDERVRGLGDVDLVRLFRVGGGGEQVVDGVDLVGAVRAGRSVDGCPSKPRYFRAAGYPIEHRGVDFGGEHGGVEDADEVEPLPADPDPLARVDAVDAHPPGGGGAEHGDRLAGGGGVQVAALGDRGADRGGSPRLVACTDSALVLIAGISGLR